MYCPIIALLGQRAQSQPEGPHPRSRGLEGPQTSSTLSHMANNTLPRLECGILEVVGNKTKQKNIEKFKNINKLIIPRLECGILEVERAIGCIPWHLPKAPSSSFIITILILQHYLDDNPAYYMYELF